MTRPVLHQALKDARLIGWLALAWVLLLVMLQVLTVRAASVPPASIRPDHVSGIVSYALLLIRVALVGAFAAIGAVIVQSDPAVGTTAFWFTRPISIRVLLAAKLLVAGVVLVFVPIVLDIAGMLAAGLSPGDAVATVPGSLFVQLACLMPLMAIAALTVNLAQFVLAALLETAVFAVAEWAVRAHVGPPLGAMSRNLVFVALALGLVVLGSVMLVYAYRARAVARAAAAATASCIGLATVFVLWPFNLAWLSWPPARIVSSPVRVVMPVTSMRLTALGQGGWQLAGGFTFADVPSRQVVTALAMRAWIDYPSGRVEVPAAISPYGPSGEPDVPWRSVPAVMQTFAPDRIVGGLSRPLRYSFNGVIAADMYVRHAHESGVFHADVRLRVDDLRIAATTAARPGAQYRVPGCLGEIVDVAPVRSDYSISLRETCPVRLLGSPNDGLSPPRYAVRNARLAVTSLVFGPTASTGSLDVPAPIPNHLRSRWLTYQVFTPEGMDAADWMRGAELVVLQGGHIGDVIVRVTVPDITLSSLRHIGPAAPR